MKSTIKVYLLLCCCLMTTFVGLAQTQGSWTQTVTVYPKPTAAFDKATFRGDTVCKGDTVTVNFTGIAPFLLTYAVNGNDPSTIGLPAPLTVYGNDTTLVAGKAGKFIFDATVSTVSALIACATTLQDSLFVVPRPSLTISQNALCADDEFQITLIGSDPLFEVIYTVNGNSPSTLGLPTVFNDPYDTTTPLGEGVYQYVTKINPGTPGRFLFNLTSIENNGCVTDTNHLP